MIVVLADDLSGAAELAGMGAKAGLKSTVLLTGSEELPIPSSSALVAIDANTRAQTKEEAGRRTEAIARQIAELEPELIYKKTDSVLRGHVGTECAILARTLGRSKVVLLPANPSRGRCISKGHYTIDGIPLHETPFKNDPDFPVHTSSLLDLLPADAETFMGLRWHVPSQESVTQLDACARMNGLDRSSLHAGAADYFGALLKAHGHELSSRAPALTNTGSRPLWVCGSRLAWSSYWSQQRLAESYEIAILPSRPQALPAVLAIGEQETRMPRDCLTDLIQAAQWTIEELVPDGLFLEGGATAHGLCRKMGWTTFQVVPTPDPGVGILQAESNGLRLHVKPGSYPWPSWALPS